MRGKKSSKTLRVTDSGSDCFTERKLLFTKTMPALSQNIFLHFCPNIILKPTIAQKSQTHRANLKPSLCVFLTAGNHLTLAFLAYKI